MQVIKALISLSSYPIPAQVVENIIDEQGLEAAALADKETRGSRAFKLAKAHVFRFLADAPNVSQGGISYSFSEDERSRFSSLANAIFNEFGETDETDEVSCGYIGEDF